MANEPTPAEPLTLERLDAIIAKFNAREEMGVGSAEFGELLALARRAIRVEAVVEACLEYLEDYGGRGCIFCDVRDYDNDGGESHAEECPLYIQGLITRDGKRTEQK